MMDATARDLELTNAATDETIAYVPTSDPESDSGPVGPLGSSDMITPTPLARHRYTFGSGARPLDGYTIKRAIGRGGFGEVYYATSDAGKEVALKLILRNLDVERRGVVQCMNLKCPNLLTIHDLKTNDAGDTFVIMEYVAGPSLANVLAQYPDGMPPHEVRAWLKGLVEGVAYLHDHGIVHRDLKPANLFMEEGIVKIGDYGLAKLITPSQGSEHSESIGTCHYMAPEISSGKYHKPIDVYAIGVILYEMLTGQVPFEGETVGEVLMKHLTARPDLSKLAEPYRTIVGRALAKDPNHRPGRVYDLLPPEDAPRMPSVRFIGEGKVTPPSRPSPGPEAEEVLRIEAEEPIYYIGPETRPPRPIRRPVIGPRLRAGWAALRPRTPVREPIRRVSPVGYPRSAPATAPTVAPPEPPPLPSGRVRVAELATSMLWAAPLTALLALPAAGLLGIEPAAEPQKFAYLLVMTLLGTWSLLGAAKVLEGRTVEPATRRMIYLGIGLLLGTASLLFDQAFRFGPAPGGPRGVLVGNGPLPWPVDGPWSNEAVGYLAYFGGLFLLNGWGKLAGRDRKARFRVWPIFVAGLLATLLWPLSTTAEPASIAVATLIAIVTQLVSPWNEAAAAHTRAARARRWWTA